MAGKSKARKPVETKVSPQTEPVDRAEEELDEEQGEPASAVNIPRPATSLAVAPKEDLGNVTVLLLADPMVVSSLEDMEKARKGSETHGRLPLMTVIQAVLKAHGGSMLLKDLAAQVKEHWNRPLPATPYTLEEFVYLMVRNADNVRVG